LINKLLLDNLNRTFETDILKLLLCILDTIALKFVTGLHKLVIFAVIFEIIDQRVVGNESCYPMKNALIIRVLSNRSRENKLSAVKLLWVINQ
jgi:hypothetical protein